MSHGVVCKYHYRGKLSLWLTSVTVWLILREGVAKSPCRCGSIAEIYNGACSVAGLFLTIVQISSEFVGGQCASWRLPPKAAVSAYRRHSFVEGIRNGGLDVLKTAAVP